MHESDEISYVLPNVMPVGVRAVICGTAAGKRSALEGAYYAGHGNRFWTVLHQVGLTPRKLSPLEFNLLSDFGLGLTDLAKKASGNHRDLPKGSLDPHRFMAAMRECRPRVVAFNGKAAAQCFYRSRSRDEVSFGLQAPEPDIPPIFVLPSTSASANGYWDIKHWQAFAEFLKTA